MKIINDLINEYFEINQIKFEKWGILKVESIDTDEIINIEITLKYPGFLIGKKGYQIQHLITFISQKLNKEVKIKAKEYKNET